MSAFCIGRASDLTSAREKHGCNKVFALYATESVQDAVIVEDALEKVLSSHGKYYGDIEYDAEEARAHACYVYSRLDRRGIDAQKSRKLRLGNGRLLSDGIKDGLLPFGEFGQPF